MTDSCYEEGDRESGSCEKRRKMAYARVNIRPEKNKCISQRWGMRLKVEGLRGQSRQCEARVITTEVVSP